ncbi:MAG: putative toxin-antitoxin system toxin component, PIN family [Candidatus Doudnabacteria bacterium CG10_big_fil_rev_8_21_14_0_10_41_10]|uniref:Putative toxin-antitoxin system toxin component, PIN family n=1 Tax=Candidatus Doudnabacteria bacterium CG10_big_fil_rev_8_21_14_0_10_41_10 TaxID=1974551 RepID=A0A2H0VCI8_9BACT|nr:MAG: putative toxin-antitoxin system toxin component, PIN family [Candidatus Doudnabacteria bacterium CG10_big_fil_rev_8_21_14_0_10_41_10]
MRVVIDTNLLIDGAGDDFNYGNRIIDEVIAGRVQVFANRATLKENRLLASLKIKDVKYLEKLEEFFNAIKQVKSDKRLNIVEDKEDNKLVESAVTAKVDFLISADRHLLKLEKYGRIQMVTPQEFWNKYEDQSGNAWKNWVDQFIRQ